MEIPTGTSGNETFGTSENGAIGFDLRDRLRGPCLLTMGDHLLDPGIAQRLIQAPLPESGILLGGN
ncbi:MAG: hypothetical protein OXC14_11230 [Rhodospirillaceae bacterium]|nr:hypothetical protein [Rhodospirillaceae bacterium]